MSYRNTLIKSIQRGTITLTGVTTNTATITAVDPANSLLHWLGETGTDNAVNSTERTFTAIAFTNGTTLTATRTSATANATVSWAVIEFYPGVLKSVQRGTVAGAGGTATITAVNPAKAMLGFLGRVGDNNNYVGQNSSTRLALTNATTVTSTGGAAAFVTGYEVAEFF